MTRSLTLTPEVERRIDDLASRTGRTTTFHLREILERGLDDAEDYYLAASVLARVAQGTEEVHSATNVRRDLGLES